MLAMWVLKDTEVWGWPATCAEHSSIHFTHVPIADCGLTNTSTQHAVSESGVLAEMQCSYAGGFDYWWWAPLGTGETMHAL